ncbi:Holliday junction ATP-dependent DNA helicase RuvA [Candidatus Xiphinematobacter sp. Idaho Grape]|uniref:Holliday junction branch migration protein RuvA n=1 Tax=Candidatus Xiphinematobacter sp. Idaho Grape TaxID=1704307 RepID=UPI0007061C35|nr:Holliday junction branch migration protein RuvA [Candidatus Xiphinematobacter sp. Idaho Grape]ALJ56797.1 Holliday junction ATP-dependent DNA helicase RuvA [Candidatus Xiphinematobacter sp. Idaho Grape]
MIAFLEGILSEILPAQIAINVHGVGYQLHVPTSIICQLPKIGEKVRILTHLLVREDSHVLYGFISSDERDLFRLLVQRVSGVGPKLALSILSRMSVDAFKAAVIRSDLTTISCVNGMGRKTAERVILELRDKLGVVAEWEEVGLTHIDKHASANASDAVFALMSLGYRKPEARRMVYQVLKHSHGLVSSEELVRKALKL